MKARWIIASLGITLGLLASACADPVTVLREASAHTAAPAPAGGSPFAEHQS